MRSVIAERLTSVMRASGLVLLAAVTVLPCCARAQDSVAPPVDLPPVGFGTLGQDDISLRFQTPNFLISIMPLDERIIRLLAPDTHASLQRLLEARRSEVEEAARRQGIRTPTLFLVTFFGKQDHARFDPEALTVTSQNRFFRAAELLPVSPGFDDRQLRQRETATAIYMYDDGIRLFDPLTFSIAGLSTDQWEGILRTIDRERSSVDARAAAARRPS